MSSAQLLTLPGRSKPYIMAHRGNRAVCPENTLAAFKQAILDGADILETDLHLTRDGKFVCIHDATLERTTDGQGAVAEKTLTELQALSAARGFPEHSTERIPTLADLAAILPHDIALALELKTDRFLEAEVCSQLAAELDELGVRGRTVVLSFSSDRLRTMRSAASDIPTGWITLSNPWPVRDVQLLGPFWPLILLNPFYVMLAHRGGQLVCPLDPSPEKRVWLYRLLGCDAILGDNPRELVKRIPAKGALLERIQGEG